MTQQDIKYRPDGSIDHSFYMQRGRVMRSEAAHGLFAGLTNVLARRVPAKRKARA